MNFKVGQFLQYVHLEPIWKLTDLHVIVNLKVISEKEKNDIYNTFVVLKIVFFIHFSWLLTVRCNYEYSSGIVCKLADDKMSLPKKLDSQDFKPNLC